jgi:EAL domain-containing protein (putative c-di-GMP-specific phosphodiesterase class I)/GGDEF domain-containing protein
VDASIDKATSLRAERDRYVSLAFCWADLLFELDRSFNILFVAGATEAFFGRKMNSLIGTSFRDLVAPADVPLIGQMLKHIVKTGRLQDETIRIVGPAGTQLRVTMSAYCLDAEHGHLFVGLRKTAGIAKATALAVPTDEESGLFDSGTFAELAADRLKKMQAAGEDAKVTLLAVPGMGELKDNIDPNSGDTLIRSVGEFLKANSLGGDSVAKVSDDRFSIIHAAGTNVEELVKRIEDITQRADPTGVGLKAEAATMSMDARPDVSEEDLAKGLLYTLSHFRDAEGDKLNIKDMASNMSTMIGQAMSEVSNFRKVVADANFYVALQPIVHVVTGEIHHYEALCRFDKNSGASPFKTITFAEETGLIHEFDYAMAKKVVEWLTKFPRNNDRYRVAVNVSGFSIGKESYVESLLRMLKENDWLQGKLMFEITESSRMTDLDSANNFIQTLRQRGYHVCLDDFGAGAASFQYLSVLDVDVVKLDGSAIKNAQRAAKGQAFLTALTELCKRMKVETIAEMVDTPQTLDFCRDCGCDYVQGFLFGKPSQEVRDFSPLPKIELFAKKSSSVRL